MLTILTTELTSGRDKELNDLLDFSAVSLPLTLNIYTYIYIYIHCYITILYCIVLSLLKSMTISFIISSMIISLVKYNNKYNYEHPFNTLYCILNTQHYNSDIFGLLFFTHILVF